MPMDIFTIAARELAFAARDALADAGVPVGRVSVSDKDGDWLPKGENGGCSGCEQLVVVPATEVHPKDNFGNSGTGVDRGAMQRSVRFRLVAGWCINEDLDQLDGHLELPPEDPANEDSAWAEASRLVRARHTLTGHRLLKAWEYRLCAAPEIGYGRPRLVEAKSWTEGGCAGTDMTVEVDL